MLSLFSIGLANAATLSKDIPKNIEPGKTLIVTFRISDIEVGEVFSIEEMIGNEFSIKDYKIEGAEKTEAEAEYEKKAGSGGKKTRYSWVYQATASNPKLTYTIGRRNILGTAFNPPVEQIKKLQFALKNISKKSDLPFRE